MKCYDETGILLIVAALYLDRNPLLGDRPVVVKYTRSVYIRIPSNQLFVFDPEELLVSKVMVKPIHPLRSPFFRRITPRTFPFSPALVLKTPVDS